MVRSQPTRDLYKTLTRVAFALPPEDVALVAELEALRRRVMYTAPECMQMRWVEGSEILKRHLPPTPDKLNQRQAIAVDIWTGRQ